MTKLQAHPGIAIINPLEKEKSTSFVDTSRSPGRIIKGEIISMGDYDTTMNGEKIMPERYGKVGDIIYFMSYDVEGGADYGMVDGKKVYFVKWGDLRGKIK